MDIGSYINYALRLWKFDESAAQELRDSEASSFWMSLSVIAIYGGIIGFFLILEMILNHNLYKPMEMLGYLVGILIGLFILVPLFYTIIILWSHMWINIFGGDRGFLKSLEIFTSVYLPAILFGILVFSYLYIVLMTIANLVTIIIAIILYLIYMGLGIYSVFVIVKTFSITHNMGIGNAILAGVVFYFTIFLISFIAGFVIEILSY